jgi:hypothetical protein
MSESSRALEQGQQTGLITGLGSGAPNKSIHFDYVAFDNAVPAEQSEALAVRCLLSSPVALKRPTLSADMLEKWNEEWRLINSTEASKAQWRDAKRQRNGSFDLVGVESNPGPASKGAKRALAALVSAQVQGKKKSKKPNARRGRNSSAGYGGFMSEGTSGMSNAVGPRVQGMNRGQTAAAAAYATGQASFKAMFSRQSADSVRITHRELVGSLVGSVLYTVQNDFFVNPGLPATFPWLSSQAVGWEKYKFNYLRLCSYTRTGTTTPGSIIMAPDYDAADAAPVTEQILSSYYGAREDAPWKDICLDMDKARMQGERFLRFGSLAANLDIKTYDVAQVFVATTDGTAVNWSKLWWEYDVILYNPQLPPGGLSDAGTILGAGTQTGANPFGSLGVTSGPLGISYSGLVVTINGLTPGAEYYVSFGETGTVIAGLGNPGVTGLTFRTQTAIVENSGSTVVSVAATYTATAATAVLTYSQTATTITGAWFVIASLIPTPTF